MRKGIISFLVCLSLISCSRGHKGGESIQIKGSDTMVNLVQAWAEEFMKQSPKAFLSVTGGGSGTGIAALLNKTCQIVSSSREMKDEELKLAKAKGINPEKFIVALDGLSVVVHPSNPIKKLTLAQLSDIFSGKLTNWQQLGGQEGKIVVLSREINSGSHEYFKEHVLGKKNEFSNDALLLPSSQAIADEVAQNPMAIGYYGMGYLSPAQKPIAIAKDINSPFVEPTIEAVRNGSYPISRPLIMYTNGQPTGIVKGFMDFMLSKEGQAIVQQIDFVPVK